MQFLTSLFGGSGDTLLEIGLALGIVLVLIVLAVWALKFVFKTSGNIGRGRNRRLTLVDAMPIDQKRQLLIIRRDNVEHLIMTGGPQDLVVESGIPVEQQPVRPVVRRPVSAAPQQPNAAGRTRESRSAAARTEPVVPPIERNRDMPGQFTERRPASLRHTGLMRATGRGEPVVLPPRLENSDPIGSDSAKQGQDSFGQGDGRQGIRRTSFSSEGN